MSEVSGVGDAQPTPDVLRRILQNKAEVVAERRARVPLSELTEQIVRAPAPRGFRQALAARIDAGRPGVIAEIKRASPSKGVLREPYDPAWIARSYEAGGATCLSVLTDEAFFGGADDHLAAARAACGLPLLRKDFVIDAYQVHESRALGADCILLIVAALGDSALAELHHLGRSLGMDVLVEVHSQGELERALAVGPDLLGVNNRDLRTFETDTATTLRLRQRIPPEVLLVTESGIHDGEQVAEMRRRGVHGFLVGEAFMRAPDPGARLSELFRG